MAIKDDTPIRVLGLVVLLFFGIYVQIYVYADTVARLWYYFQEPRAHPPHLHERTTYYLDNAAPEYLTVERIGQKRYKVFFHKTPENPMSDYVVITNPNGENYPYFQASYLRSEGNIVLLTLVEHIPYLIDTIVSEKYQFVLQSYSYWAHRLEGYDNYNIITDSDFSSINRYTIPLYKIAVDFEPDNKVVYGDSIQWPRKKAVIVQKEK